MAKRKWLLEEADYSKIHFYDNPMWLIVSKHNNSIIALYDDGDKFKVEDDEECVCVINKNK